MKHSLFSPSSSSRWLRCSGSTKFVVPQSSSSYAAEGSLAHALVEKGPDVGEKELTKYSEEMKTNAQIFHKYVAENIPKEYIKKTEAFLKYNKDLYGTVDLVAYNEDKMHIVDYKYGMKVKVKAEQNTQLMLYAMCAIKEFKLKNIKDISVHIVQPRIKNISRYDFIVDDLLSFEEKVLNQIDEAKNNPQYVAGYPQCVYCPGKNKCISFHKMVNAELLIRDRYEMLTSEEKEESLEKKDCVLDYYERIEKDLIFDIDSGEYKPKKFELVVTKRKAIDSDALTILTDKGYDLSSIAEYKVKALSKLEKIIKPEDLKRITKFNYKRRLKNA